MEFAVMFVGFALLGLVIFDAKTVYCEKPAVVKIGAVFTYDSVIGRGAKTAMEMAVEDINSDPTILNGTALKMIKEDVNCSVFLGSIKAFQVIEEEVVAVVGPQSSAIARIIAHIANGLKIPIISYAATNPALSSLQFPHFLRTAPSDSKQMAAIAHIIDYYEWKDIIAIFVDNDYGRNGITILGNELAKRMARITHKLPLSPQYNLSEISDILSQSKSLGPRVYVVHIDPDPRLEFFRMVKKLDMMRTDYVWLATDWLSSTLDSFRWDENYREILEGVVTIRPHIPITSKKESFFSHWREKSTQSNITAYGLFAYDTVWLVAHSIDKFLKDRGAVTFSLRHNLQFGNLSVFDGGDLLLKFLSNSKSTGLTGLVQFGADRSRLGIDYEIINVVQGTTFMVGYWSNETGLSVQSPQSLKGNEFTSDIQLQKLNNITWPGGKVERPRGWVVATTERPLIIGFPKRVSFNEFVTELNHSQSVEGYCIDIFHEVREMVPYEVPFRFESFGDGLKNPNYDELVRMVANNVFDAAVGDIAIVANRIEIADFTQPFAATGLVIVAPTRNMTSSGWVFIKPFTLEMWSAIAASFVIIGIVIWMLEHRVNDDFRGPPSRQLRTMFLFSFSTLFKGNYENTVSTLGRIVMVVWLFLLLVITSSYTASLSSILTVQQLSTYITGIESLISSGLPIGYQVGSFAYRYMIDSLNIHPSRLVCLKSPEEYETALKQGPENGGVAAIVDEIPYVELFLSNQTDFGIVGQPFTRSGWGFAFRKDSPLAIDMSTAMLKLSETGKLQKIHEKWFCKFGCPEERTRKSEENQLHLSSFWALYCVCGLFAITALVIFLIRAVHQYLKYRQKQMDPSSPAFSISSNLHFSQVLHNFLQFIDEKEEAIKKIFAHHEKPSTQVSQ